MSKRKPAKSNTSSGPFTSKLPDRVFMPGIPPMPEMYLPPTPIEEGAVRITAVETCIPQELFPGLILMRIHTDAGIIGHGETYYAPHAVAGLIHDWMVNRLLGQDALAIESHWRFFYERFANFGVRGAELRAISAIDLALWDILGQVTRQPIYRLLGGPVRSRIAVYNSCGNPTYGPRKDGVMGWSGYGSIGDPGPLGDSYNLFHHPIDLIEDLLSEGINAFKTWCFDYPAHRHGGMRISLSDVEAGMKPLREIRKHFGNKVEFMVDGHGFFMLPAALRIAEALREVQPLWLEDILKTDNLDTIADFRRQSRMPISVSEMLLTRADYNQVLMQKAADFVMIDPTWVGGISETARLAHLAQGYNVPVSIHDCTGPLTLFAGLHVGAAVPGCCFQETVRAQIRTVYKFLIDSPVVIKDGHAELPKGPGLGVRLNPDLFKPGREGYRISQIKKS
ncbi:MAG: mandelate racemase/muconate lactonizing enzyme family protein [Planctomycetota bacterium]|nr:mandelate racemase/muconate lactonizing enzyme family protein [Planctomycetota bacterium]